MVFFIGFQIKLLSNIHIYIYIVAEELGVLAIDLEFVHTISKHNCDALLNGF